MLHATRPARSLTQFIVVVLAAVTACFASSNWIFAQSSRSSLADAVEKMDRVGITKLLEQRVDVNAAQSDGMTALHWAVYHDDVSTTRALIRAQADVGRENRYAVRPLSIACENGNAAIVGMLLDAGADANTVLDGGESVLMTAARTGKVDVVRKLLAHGAKVEATERKGQTALMWAAAEGHHEVVSVLIEAGSDMRASLPSGFTPLFFAVREGRSQVVKILLDAGVDVNSPMEPERSTGKGPAKGTTPLVLAVENGHFDLAVELLKAGADPNDQRSGFTPLHMMSWVRKPNRGDGDDGDPAPIGSGNLNSMQFVRQLVEHGADVNSRLNRGASGRGKLSRTGATPFMLAAVTADIGLMRLLVELGADPLIPNVDNCTPLMAAAGVGTLAPGEEAGTESEVLEAVQYILELGGDLHTIDENGETAMHGAAYKSLPKVVKFLADRGLRIDVWNRPNKYGWTPLLIAEGHRPGNYKPSAETIAAIHQVMIANGIQPPPRTPRGADPGDYAPKGAAKRKGTKKNAGT